MKTIKVISLFCLLLNAYCLRAYDFSVDGIYYNILSETENTVEVTYDSDIYSPESTYSDFVVLQPSVTYNGTTYRVTSIGSHAFYNDNVTKVIIPSGVMSIGNNAFVSCSKLNSVTIPKSVTAIGDYAFYGCTSLPNVLLPKNLQKIGDYAFSGCSFLNSITIPSTVTVIGNHAFHNCLRLSTVTNLSSTPQSIDSNCFSNFEGILWVMEGRKSAYLSTNVWNRFDILEIPENMIEKECEAPVITVKDGKIDISCATEGSSVRFMTKTFAKDIGETYTGRNEYVLPAPTYTIIAYATAEGYSPSETVIKNITMGNSDAIKGDMNGDGKVTMADANIIVNQFLGEREDPQPSIREQIVFDFSTATDSECLNSIKENGIDIYRSTDNNSFTTKSSIVKFSGTNWIYSNNLYSENQKEYFRAISPAGTDLTTLTQGNDYIWGTSEASTANTRSKSIPMPMEHAMSKVCIKLTTTSGASSIDVSNATIEITDIANAGSLDLASGTITPASTKGNANIDRNEGSFIVIPQTIDNSAKIRITVDGNVYIVSLSDIPISEGGGITRAAEIHTQWQRNKIYTYTLQLSKTSVLVQAKSEEWKNKDVFIEW